MRPDLVVEARAWVRGEFANVEIGLREEDGTILAVKRSLAGEPRRRFPGKLLIPSAVDLHVHFRDPGSPAKEDFLSGTRGAALGGVGSVLDMPNTSPIVDRRSRLQEKHETVARKACVDWGLWSTLTSATPDALGLAQASHGVKLYLAPTSGVPEPGTGQDLRVRLETARRVQRLVALHAEQGPARPATSLADHAAVRPASGEVETIRAAATHAPDPAGVHVAHASTTDAVDAAHAAGFSVAVTPHHLLLAHDDSSLKAFAKVNPPLRARGDRDALWQRFLRGGVEILETDHAPHTVAEKRLDFADAPAGLPGVETAYPVLLRAFLQRDVSLAPLVGAYSEHPAARLGLRKGRIEPGYDADFFLVDPTAAFKIHASDLQSTSGWTPFEGHQAVRVEHHWIRGALVVEDHAFVGRAGRGRILPRVPVPPWRPVSAAESKRPVGI